MVPINKNVKIFDIFKSWTESMTLHGFPNIFRTKYHSVRVMWIICFLVSTGWCFGIITLNIINYLKYEAITTIKVVDKDSLPFPTVTVCNYNPFVTEEGLKYVSTIFENNNLTSFPNMILNNIFDDNTEDNSSLIVYNYLFLRYMTVVISKSNTEEMIKNFSLSYDQMFISCLYNLKPCHKEDWIWFFDSNFGNCFRFNAGQNSKGENVDIKHSFQAGRYNGLMVELFVGIPEDQKTLSISTGAHVFVDDNYFKPIPDQGFDVSPGFSSNLILQRIVNQKLPKPYSECTDNLDTIDSFDSDYYRKVFSSGLNYRQLNCLYAYLHMEISERCKCAEMGLNIKSENGNQCDTLEEQTCVINEYEKLTKSNFKRKVIAQCPLECRSTTYEITKSESKYPSVTYGNELIKNHRKIRALYGNKSNISIEELRDDILAINFYYENLKQTEIGQSPSITWDGLVGSVGGTLGLFLGISVLSFAELVDLIFQIFFNEFNKIKAISDQS